MSLTCPFCGQYAEVTKPHGCNGLRVYQDREQELYDKVGQALAALEQVTAVARAQAAYLARWESEDDEGRVRTEEEVSRDEYILATALQTADALGQELRTRAAILSTDEEGVVGRPVDNEAMRERTARHRQKRSDRKRALVEAVAEAEEKGTL